MLPIVRPFHIRDPRDRAAIALTPDGAHAYAASNPVSVIDVESNADGDRSRGCRRDRVDSGRSPGL